MLFRRISLVAVVVVLLLVSVMWWRSRAVPPAQLVAVDAPVVGTPSGTAAATSSVVPSQAEKPALAPTMLGGAGVRLRLSEIPAGTPLRESLERLAPEVQQRILPEMDWRMSLMKAQWTQASVVHGNQMFTPTN